MRVEPRDVRARDLPVFAFVRLTTLGVTLRASSFPARRAPRVLEIYLNMISTTG